MSISVNLFLDTRDAKTACKKNPEIRFDSVECPVKISITKDSSTTYLQTGIKIRPVHWRNHHVVGRPDKVRLNTYLENHVANVKSIILDNKESSKYVEMSVTSIKNDVERRLKGNRNSATSTSPFFLPFFEAFAERRNAKRTREIYLATVQKIKKLVHNAEDLTLDDITLDWLEEFDDILITEGNKPSTRSIDFRNIRAVINDAKKHKLIRNYPFDGFTMPIGESSDRALTIHQLRAFIRAELKPWEEKYRDFFLLSFLLIGINTEDLLHVKAIEDGRINYVRAKTHQEMSIKVEPEALEIINRYRGKSGYLLNVLDSYSSTHNWTSRVDKNLKEISKRFGLPEITMYWARHTWATLAHVDLGIELSTVSDAFGHQPEKKVTLIYIKKKDYAKVDEANRKVIDYCFAPDDRVIE